MAYPKRIQLLSVTVGLAWVILGGENVMGFVPVTRSKVQLNKSVDLKFTSRKSTRHNIGRVTSLDLRASLDDLTFKLLNPSVSNSPSNVEAIADQASESFFKIDIPSFSLPEFPDLPNQFDAILSQLPQFDQIIPNNLEFSVNPAAWLNAITDFSSFQFIFQDLSLVQQAAVLVVPFVFAVMASLYQLSFPEEDYRSGLEPYVRGKYDPIQAKVFYADHKKVVLQRSLQLVRLSNQFIIGFLLDKYLFKRDEDPVQRTKRAAELLELITKLGPTAIKIGQALSVRPDIIPTEYATALSSLQDQVPPFDSRAARAILQEELGIAKFNELQGMANADPVASASIGQVYKATINTPEHPNQQVAIKVQRPNVLSEIALDLHIVREFAPFYQRYIARSSTDLQTLANEWGRGFIAELDYRQEAESTTRFNMEMRKRNLDAVTAPIVVQDFSTEQILVTEWVDGTRIDQSDEEDIPRLCSVALNAYLVMLLELQCLHCDPHPGNLLRTTDGRLCILDFGMTLEIDPTLQYSLLEYIAHCTSDDYERVPEDLVNMGFLKADKLEYAKRSGILEPLVYFLREAGKGGGAKGVRERVLAGMY